MVYVVEVARFCREERETFGERRRRRREESKVNV